MKVREILAGLIVELREAGVESARAEAEILLAAVLDLLDEPRPALYAAGERELTSAEARTLAGLALRRSSGEPSQYLVGRAWFRELTLAVGPGVLIPRPETEQLVEQILEWLGARPSGAEVRPAVSDPARVLDVGTGSGCIALSIALEAKGTQVVGVESSKIALRWAERNLERLRATDPEAAGRVRLLQSDLFSGLTEEPPFDVVVSNPPYVGREEAERLPREVLDHEPPEALFAPGRSTSVLEAIVDNAMQFLVPGGLLALEIGETQADNVAGRIRAAVSEGHPVYAAPRVLEDLSGRPRLVLAERRPDTGPAHGGAWQPQPR